MELSAGTRIGRYTVLEHVGTGTAEVYRGHDERFGRPVAVKLLRGTGERIRAEARAVATLHHPHIVLMIDVEEYDGRLCLIQEWVEGGSVEDRLGRTGSLGLGETVRMGRQVASALDYAHRNSILHRDIKPSNVLRTAEGDYKLADFGAAGTLEADTGLTRAGVIAGTPLYMSPEQVTGGRQSPASDLFGLGLLLYRCLYGSLPSASADNYVSLARLRLLQITVPPSPVRALLQRCLAVDPGQRVQSAAEVLAALDAITVPHQAGAPAFPVPTAWQATATPATVPPPVGVPPPPSPGYGQGGSPLEVSPPSERPRKPVALWIGPAVLSAVLLGVGAWLIGAGWGLVRAAAGLVTVGLALGLARWIRQRWTSRAPETEQHAANLIFGAHQREELTQSLIIEVDQVVSNLTTLDAKILGMTVVAMIHQYEDAKKWSHKQKALLDMVTLMEKLQQHLSPWHVRHKDAIATAVAVIGALTGLAGVVSGFL